MRFPSPGIGPNRVSQPLHRSQSHLLRPLSRSSHALKPLRRTETQTCGITHVRLKIAPSNSRSRDFSPLHRPSETQRTTRWDSALESPRFSANQAVQPLGRSCLSVFTTSSGAIRQNCVLSRPHNWARTCVRSPVSDHLTSGGLSSCHGADTPA